MTGGQNRKLDTGYHDRRLARRHRDPEFGAEFELYRAEIAAVDAIVNALDGLRERSGMTKAALARTIDKHPAAVRRLLTASGNPELRTVVAIAQALGAEVRIMPKTRPRAALGVGARAPPDSGSLSYPASAYARGQGGGSRLLPPRGTVRFPRKRSLTRGRQKPSGSWPSKGSTGRRSP
jgi:DNA-binding phage protein